MLHRLASIVLFLFLGARDSVAQQCPRWEPGYGRSGISGVGRCMSAFDLGSGPQLAVGGTFAAAGSVAVQNVAAFSPGGWSAMGSGLGIPPAFAGVDNLLVHDDGSGPALYAGGSFTTTGSAPALHVARFDGSQWSQVGAGLGFDVWTLATLDDGTGPALYAGGYWQDGSLASNVARWDGASWTPLAQGLSPWVSALVAYDDGTGSKLYAGGVFTLAGPNQECIAVWNGTTWDSVGSGLSHPFAPQVDALAVFDGGSGPELVAAGEFTMAGATPATGVARWNGTAWSALGAGLTNGSIPRDLEVYDDGSGAALYVAGEISLASGVTFIARWDGAAWSGLGAGVGYEPWCLAVYDDGNGPGLFVSGAFGVAGGVSVASFARWDGTNWSNPDPTPDVGPGPVVRALEFHDDGTGSAMYVAGTQKGQPARFDGAAWSSVGGGVEGLVFAMLSYDDGSGPALFVGGLFDHAGGQPARNIAKWDGRSWWPLGPGVNNTVTSLFVHDDGTGPALYVGGAFQQAGGIPARSIARWDGSSWTSLGTGIPGSGVAFTHSMASFDDGSGMQLWAATSESSTVYRWNGAVWSGAGSGLNSAVSDLLVFDDGHGPQLYAGGNATSKVQRWDFFQGWVPIGVGLTGAIQKLAVYDDGAGPQLYAGGRVQFADQTSANLARFDGQTWSGLALGLTAYSVPDVRALAVGTLGGAASPSLFVGGYFETAGRFASASLAEWRGCGAAGEPFCLGDAESAACPCANTGAWRRGCENSAATGGSLLSASGQANPDTIVLESSGELPSALSVFIQGDASVPPTAFGDGLRCVGGSSKRLYVKSAVQGVVRAPEQGEPSVSQRSADLGDPIPPGGTRYYQTYYRDPRAIFCPAPQGELWNVSSGLKLTW